MIRPAQLCLSAVLAAAPALAQPVAGPALDEVLRDEGAQVLRLRYVQPDLDIDGAADLARRLCLADAPERAGPDWEVVVSISAVALPFGQTNPDVVQVFEAFTWQDGDCIWSDY